MHCQIKRQRNRVQEERFNFLEIVSQTKSKQSKKTKPSILAPKLVLLNSLDCLSTVEDPAEKKNPVTTKMQERSPSEVTSVFEYRRKRREEKQLSSSQKFGMQTETEKEDKNSTVTVHEKEKGTGPYVKVREKLNLIGSPAHFSEGLKPSMDNKSTTHRMKLNSEGAKPAAEFLSVRQGLHSTGTASARSKVTANSMLGNPVRKGNKPLTSVMQMGSTMMENDGRNSTVITHEIKKDFDEMGREKDPHVKVREKFNLHGDSGRESSWNSADSSENTTNSKPPSVGRLNSERVSTLKDNFETIGASRSTHSGRGLFKKCGSPIEKEEKHSTTSKEFQTTEKKKDGDGTQTIKNIFHNTYTTHVTQQIMEDPKQVEVVFRSYQDFKDHAAQSVIPSDKSYQEVISTNEKDLEQQARVCEEIDSEKKKITERQKAKEAKKKEKKNAWEKFSSCFGDCCLSSVECL